MRREKLRTAPSFDANGEASSGRREILSVAVADKLIGVGRILTRRKFVDFVAFLLCGDRCCLDAGPMAMKLFGANRSVRDLDINVGQRFPVLIDYDASD